MTTNQNPICITDYDISKFAQLPEWQPLAQVLNAVARAANHAHVGEGQDALVEAVGHLARGIAFMDCCDKCDRSIDGTLVDTSAAPYATEVEARWLCGRYRCEHGHEWTCGYSLELPLLMAGLP